MYVSVMLWNKTAITFYQDTDPKCTVERSPSMTKYVVELLRLPLREVSDSFKTFYGMTLKA